MTRPTDRIAVTHAGSLPRPPELQRLLIREAGAEPVDPARLSAAVDGAVQAAVEHQLACGVDVGNDGEQDRPSYVTYLAERMDGFSGEAVPRAPLADFVAYPGFAQLFNERYGPTSGPMTMPEATGELHYRDLEPLRAELERFAQARAAADGEFAQGFATAPSPGVAAMAFPNAYYETHEAYVGAMARELRTEYRCIADSGLLLQIDAPDLTARRYERWAHVPEDEYAALIDLHVQAINEALDGIPREQVRLHCCWGNHNGPHVHDVEMPDLLPALYGANVGALLLPFANPRHAHEIAALADQPPPADVAIVVGAIDVTTNIVEHPALVEQRLVAAAEAIGDPERVLAGTDCGFGTLADMAFVAEELVWVKLRALYDGAQRASLRLWR
jgi:5-methyltetrahydropteroyltriglutamate--homocysteine methyltransferase